MLKLYMDQPWIRFGPQIYGSSEKPSEAWDITCGLSIVKPFSGIIWIHLVGLKKNNGNYGN